MAITTDAFWQLGLTFQDRDKNTSQMQLLLPDAIVIADAVAAIDGAFGALVGALSDAVLVGYSFSRGGYDYAAAIAPETSDVERKGSFSFRADNGQVLRVTVPSIKNTLVVDGTNKINESDAAVAAFIDYILNGVAGVLAPTTNAGGNPAQVINAVKTHRGSSRG